MTSALKIPTKEMEKHLAAAAWAGVTIDPDFQIIGPNTHCELKYTAIQNVLDMGGYLGAQTPLTAEDVKNETARRKKIAEENK